MDITQRLRDNHSAITYNRSDCQYLSTDHWKEAPSTLARVLHNTGWADNEKTTITFYGSDFIGQTSWDALVGMNGLSDESGQIGHSTITAYRPLR